MVEPLRRRVLLAAILVAGLAIAGAAAGAAELSSETASQDPNDLEPPSQNTDQTVKIVFFGGSINVHFDVWIWYPARSAAEAEAARDGTLDPDWFRPTERIRAIHDRTGGAGETLDPGSVSVIYTSNRPGEFPSDPEHGWIMVTQSISWENYLEDGGEDVSIGRNHTVPFGPGWNVRVNMPDDWEPETLNGDPVLRGAQGDMEYRWTLDENAPDPLITVDESNVTTRVESDQPIGIAGGLLLSILVFASVAMLNAARRRR